MIEDWLPQPTLHQGHAYIDHLELEDLGLIVSEVEGEAMEVEVALHRSHRLEDPVHVLDHALVDGLDELEGLRCVLNLIELFVEGELNPLKGQGQEVESLLLQLLQGLEISSLEKLVLFEEVVSLK